MPVLKSVLYIVITFMLVLGTIFSLRSNYTIDIPDSMILNIKDYLNLQEVSPIASAIMSQVSHSLPSCGDICSYKGTQVPDSSNNYFPKLTKNIDCQNIIGRMAYRNHVILNPAPEKPPPELLDEFIQFGEMPISEFAYYNQPPLRANFTYDEEHITNLTKRARKGGNLNTYNDNGTMLAMLSKHQEALKGKRGLVIGTLRPWLEAMILAQDTAEITTLEYASLFINHPQVRVFSPYDYADLYLTQQPELFDFASSFSSIEHSGLGRYGDPLNPYGDMEATAQVWCLLKPGGLFIVGVPIAHSGDDASYLKWNANRVYGPKRLQHFAANWDLVEYTKTPRDVVLVLQKPT